MKVRLVAVVVMLALVAMSVPVYAGGASGCASTLSSNPIKETIEKTDSINEMRSKPAPKMVYVKDALGNSVPSQTDNSGKNYLGN